MKREEQKVKTRTNEGPVKRDEGPFQDSKLLLHHVNLHEDDSCKNRSFYYRTDIQATDFV